MKITKKSKKEIALLREGGKILTEALFAVAEKAKMFAKEGISAYELDQLAEKIIRSHGAIPSFLGYTDGYSEPYPASLCVSINDEVVHGLPIKNKIIKSGDLLKLDLGVEYKGLFTDSAITVGIGDVSIIAKKIIDVTKRSLEIGIEQIYHRSTTGNYGNAVEKYVKMNGLSVVRKLVGHGVGYEVHEAPQIPNFGKPGSGIVIEEGMVLALEPMVNEGKSDVRMASDGFTFKTKDGKLSGHFEHTVVVTENGCEVLTLME